MSDREQKGTPSLPASPRERGTETVLPGEGADVEELPDSLAVGSVVCDRYEVLARVGSGGSATVYRVLDRKTERELALKLLREGSWNDKTRKRLQREAELGRNFEHPHVVRVYDVHLEDPAFLTMEFVSGDTLAARMRSGLAMEESLGITRQIALGLRALHKEGVVHRDIKPSNILTAEGVVKIADLGLLRLVAPEATRVTASETIVGTYEYVAPEQALGAEINPAADLYSLGVVLFEMLTGRLPHRHSSALGALLERVSDSAPTLAEGGFEAPEWLESLVACLLERDPKRRLGTADELIAVLDSRHVLTGHSGRSRRDRRAGATWFLALVATAGLALAAWGAYRERVSYKAIVQLQKGEGVTEAAGEDGEVLWSRADLELQRARVIRAPDGKQKIAAILAGAGEKSIEVLQHLSVLDAQTGQLEASVKLESGAHYFPGIGQAWRVYLDADDLNGDAVDEVLVTYQHATNFQSFSVLYEPSTGQSRAVAVSSGHLEYQGATDLDGDRDQELLYSAWAQNFGDRRAIMAVDVAPAVGSRGSGALFPAFSPDRPDAGLDQGRVLEWYQLLPRESCPAQTCVQVSQAGDRLLIDGPAPFELTVMGFETGPGGLDPARARNRRLAYAELARANSLRTSGSGTQALEFHARALQAARAARLTELSEWIEALRPTFLVSADRFEQAERELLLMPEKPDWAEGTYLAAREMHLRGEPARAVRWHRLALERSRTGGWSTRPIEYLINVALATLESQDWETFWEIFEDYEANEWLRDQTSTKVIRQLAKAWSGSKEKVGPLQIEGQLAHDEIRYWDLEHRYHRGDREGLLDALRVEVQVNTEASAPTRSLLALMEGESGDLEGAMVLARQADLQAASDAAIDVVARVYRAEIARRLEQVASMVEESRRSSGFVPEVERSLRSSRAFDAGVLEFIEFLLQGTSDPTRATPVERDASFSVRVPGG